MRHYNSQPQCDECAKFIPYARATYREKSDGMPLPSPVGYWTGLCEKCDAEEKSELAYINGPHG